MYKTILQLFFLLIFYNLSFVEGNFSKANPGNDNITTKTDIEDRQFRGPCTGSHTFTNVWEYIYLESVNYPYNYPPNLDCSYTVESPTGTQIRLECADFNVEWNQWSQDCADKDWFYYSVSGDRQQDRQPVCGSGTIYNVSTGSRFTLGFHSDQKNTPSNQIWRYRCKLTAVPTSCSCGKSGAVNCADVETRIVGGSEALLAEFPWRVALMLPGQGVFCAGTLISNNWVMTAAHCYDGVVGEQISARIGDHNVKQEGPNKPILIDVGEGDRIKNSFYDKNTQDSDIALFRLSEPVEYNTYVQPICLPWKYTFADFEGQVATASGWGTTSFGGPQSDVLRKVRLNVVNNPNCKKAWAGRNITITERMICASAPGGDTCQSDSGGTLDYRDPSTGQYYGIGIVSFGSGCAEPGLPPAVYTQMVNFLGWVEQNTGETYCKA